MITILARAYTPVRKGIRPDDLGYVFGNNRINFANRNVAQKFAKNWVLKGLHCKVPHENAAVVKDNKVLFFTRGTTYGVEVPTDDVWNLGQNYSNMTVFHGHTDSYGAKASPLSYGDLYIFNQNKLYSKLIAYNKEGEASIFIKLSKFKKLNMDKFFRVRQDMETALLQNPSPEQKEVINEFHAWDKARGHLEDYEFYSRKTDLFYNEMRTAYGRKKMHDFYKEELPWHRLKYVTNFSNAK
ncbi:MAG: hypothetical protein LBK53_01050 [Heliobacteriaceae bacterium]|jgi:hypothetical protein|nr:hypothetical protein [Heliobacteriaceae bacterium]